MERNGNRARVAIAARHRRKIALHARLARRSSNEPVRMQDARCVTVAARVPRASLADQRKSRDVSRSYKSRVRPVGAGSVREVRSGCDSCDRTHHNGRGGPCDPRTIIAAGWLTAALAAFLRDPGVRAGAEGRGHRADLRELPREAQNSTILLTGHGAKNDANGSACQACHGDATRAPEGPDRRASRRTR